MSDYKLSYGINPECDVWHWEVFEDAKRLAQGHEKTNAAARVQAILFVLQTEQDVA